MQIKHGLAMWSEFPEGVPNRATSWCLDPAIWRNAIKYRMQSWGAIGITDLQTIKTRLLDDRYHRRVAHLNNGVIRINSS